jgi:hypothetical protein
LRKKIRNSLEISAGFGGILTVFCLGTKIFKKINCVIGKSFVYYKCVDAKEVPIKE